MESAWAVPATKAMLTNFSRELFIQLKRMIDIKNLSQFIASACLSGRVRRGIDKYAALDPGIEGLRPGIRYEQ